MRYEDMQSGTLPRDGQHMPDQEPGRRVRIGHPRQYVTPGHKRPHDGFMSQNFPVGTGTAIIDNINAGVSQQTVADDRNIRSGAGTDRLCRLCAAKQRAGMQTA